MRAGGALRAGALDFALVFAAGFVLGPIRILWLVPRVGERAAELIEMPIMLAVIVFAGRWVVRRLAMGLVAVVLLLVVEVTVVLRLRGMTFDDYLAQRDPVTATAYYLSVGFFGLLPLLLARAGRHRA